MTLENSKIMLPKSKDLSLWLENLMCYIMLKCTSFSTVIPNGNQVNQTETDPPNRLEH